MTDTFGNYSACAMLLQIIILLNSCLNWKKLTLGFLLARTVLVMTNLYVYGNYFFHFHSKIGHLCTTFIMSNFKMVVYTAILLYDKEKSFIRLQRAN